MTAGSSASRCRRGRRRACATCGSCSRSSARRRNGRDRGGRSGRRRRSDRDRRCSNCGALAPCSALTDSRGDRRHPALSDARTAGQLRRAGAAASTPAPAGIATGGSRGAARRGCAGPWSKRRCTAPNATGSRLAGGAAAWRCAKARSKRASRSRGVLCEEIYRLWIGIA